MRDESSPHVQREIFRKVFGRIDEVSSMPSLIEIQKKSYEHFLQFEEPEGGRKEHGLQLALQSVFPITDFSDAAMLEFVKYTFSPPRYDVLECRQSDLTYAAPLRLTLRLTTFSTNEETGARSILDVKEQDVYVGDIPLMTDSGTFVVNGAERVIVSQMHRSPGVFFEHDKGKTHASGRLLFASRVIPYRGSWLDFEFEAKDIINARIDRRRKFPATTLLYALGYSTGDILSLFYDKRVFKRSPEGWSVPYSFLRYRGSRLPYDLVNAKTGKVVVEANTKITPRLARKLLEQGLEEVFAPSTVLLGQYLAEDIVNAETGQIYAEANDEVSQELLDVLLSLNIQEVTVLDIDHVNVGGYIRNTLLVDKTGTKEQALLDIYRIIRPGEQPTLEAASSLFEGLFFDPTRYDLSAVGRVKLNARLNLECPDDVRTLCPEDIVATLKILTELRDGRGEIDDIDNLGNRRVRSVGELLENQYRLGLVRMERLVRERMSSVELDTAMPQDLVNARPVAAAVREFFGLSQLSQFMDQTNPLSEVTHKRRISALGPGGLTRERAGFEVRDVHYTHYGRICPIETPEGQNIGLINSLATYARVNKYGFIESPYRRVKDGAVTDEVVYLSAPEEARYLIAQANTPLSENDHIDVGMLNCRRAGDFEIVTPDRVDFIDVSPKQIVSVAAALIPFLENDDANRALMGSNMQRQAVPLLKSEAPFVGTGMERTVACDSGSAIVAKRSGIVEKADTTSIVISAHDKVTSDNGKTGVSAGDLDDVDVEFRGVDIYRLLKFQRSNQGTCINQKPLVRVGDHIRAGEVIADGPSTDRGDLALGRNVLAAFMPWNGYNFQDSILISERLVSDDVFTSIHIERFDIVTRDTKLGPEEITRDIPNVREEALAHLDEAGIVVIGSEVGPGDILVGKLTPQGETQMTPEEKLLRAIFGEKASDVRDTSLRLPPGSSGTVVDVRVFNRYGLEKDERSLENERLIIQELEKERYDELRVIERSIKKRVQTLLTGATLSVVPKDLALKASPIVDIEAIEDMTLNKLFALEVKNKKLNGKLDELQAYRDRETKRVDDRLKDRIDKVRRGDELAQGVLKVVKVFVAVKRKLQPGDKMAGRHGNKGVVSMIVPAEDMPYLADGTPVDIVINPLGVPSRMNVGQILETHLGWACFALGKKVSHLLKEAREIHDDHKLRVFLEKIYDKKKDGIEACSREELEVLAEDCSQGLHIATPVFDGAKDEDITRMLDLADLDTSGQEILYDGRTGEPFDRSVTIGYIYMLKLHHLVDEKIHARSVGPYSLVTQQPLGGKAQFGGQRFGEMEVWALEAYGAAYTLQEMLTVKSDDIAGRTKIYESIVRGDDSFETGVPESFNVLIKELWSLGLNLELINSQDIKYDLT